MRQQVAKAICQQTNPAKKVYDEGVKLINWDNIQIEGYTIDELKKQVEYIIDETDARRTLDEVLADFLGGYRRRFEPPHPDFPKRPLKPFKICHNENYEMLKQEIIKKGLIPSNVN